MNVQFLILFTQYCKTQILKAKQIEHIFDDDQINGKHFKSIYLLYNQASQLKICIQMTTTFVINNVTFYSMYFVSFYDLCFCRESFRFFSKAQYIRRITGFTKNMTSTSISMNLKSNQINILYERIQVLSSMQFMKEYRYFRKI